MSTDSSRCSWSRLLFSDHPGYSSKAPNSSSSGKAKIYCTLCLQADIAAEKELDQAALQHNDISFARTDQEIVQHSSASFPLSWVENPEWLAFFPSRKQDAAKHDVSVSCDGWSGENKHHYIAFMITVDRKIRTVRVHDASGERKTAENLLKLMREVIQELEKNWHVNVVAFTTDASGEARKARKLLLRERPDLITPDCFAHQVNLVVGDYMKVNKGFLLYSKAATELITWLRSKTFLLAMLRETQQQHHLPVLTIIRAVLTRWTAHYLAYRRLLDVWLALKYVVAEDQLLEGNSQIITRDAAAKEKAREMIKVIGDEQFWKAVARMKNHLEPLAIAANVTQSAFCRLDEVLLTLGSLCMHYRTLRDPEDAEVREAVLRSIENRWSKCDQDVFIAAVLPNCFIQDTPFSKSNRFLTHAGLLGLFSRLYIRFFGQTGTTDHQFELNEDIGQYSNVTGAFEDLPAMQKVVEIQAERTVNIFHQLFTSAKVLTYIY
ncbi:hypothetical protein K435DRAFT_824147 [Dendrothele bispora CBS 962.96]|uniref:DUF659 domain-containing protein n=1 Tax=Dendrothele bispora (strain CBS 962.96) TaxID=1314807 RepID=A0A4S8KR84_DENBC|nr:hypothetical protein K435DRAFT_824147 [Dendrothele bispora CBS 962.96]